MKFLLGFAVLALVLVLSPVSAYDDNEPKPTSAQESKPFGTPSSPNSAGSDQEHQGLSEPVNPPGSFSDTAEPSGASQQPEQRSVKTDSAPAPSQPQILQHPQQETSMEQDKKTESAAQQQQQQQPQEQLPASSGRGLSSLLNDMMNPNGVAHQLQIPVDGQSYEQKHLPYQPQPMQQQIQQQVQQLQEPPPQQQQQQIQPQQQQQQLPQQTQRQAQPGDIPRENLPTIIENNKQAQPQPQQQQQQQQQQQSAIALVAPPMPQDPAADGNSSLAASTSRTFGEGWTACSGSQGKYGTCKNDVTCKKDKGIPDGSCMGGLGVCCVMSLTCGDKSHENNTFFANQDFPEPNWEARLCEVEIKKKYSKISQIMIEFEEFELAPPNHEGECITDVFQVKLASGRPSPYSQLRLCGQNTGQHMYLDVSQIEEPLVLSVATSGGGFPRRYSIRIVQMDDKNYLLAPPGCLQYYTDTIGHFRSFNLGQNLKNLYYAICFRIDNGYSGIRFSSNFFGMNGHQCRKQKPHSIGSFSHGGPHRLGNATYEPPHPHHVGGPPPPQPGYALPQPRPKYQQQLPPPQPLPLPPQQRPQYGPPESVPVYAPPQHYPGSQRLKRDEIPEMPVDQQVDQQDQSEQREQRTLHEHDKKHFEHFEHDKKHHEHFEHHEPTSYPSAYGGYANSYGPPPPPPTYGPHYGPPAHQPPAYGHHQPHPQHQWHEHEGKKEWKEGKWEDKKDDKWLWQDQKWGWKSDKKDEKLGWWGEKKEDKLGWKDDKFGWKIDKKDEKLEYKHEPYYQQPQHYQHPHHNQSSGYGPNYYGQAPGYYGPPAHGASAHYGASYGGEYHHKEVDKYGDKKYEHLQHKHEKSHFQDKEAKKDDKWWSLWSKKEEKKDKKEKFVSHHEALFPMMHIPEMPHCEPRFCGANDVITFPPSGDSISEMCGNGFNRGRGHKIVSGSPLVVYVSNRGHNRGAGFDLNYEQVFYVPKPYKK